MAKGRKQETTPVGNVEIETRVTVMEPSNRIIAKRQKDTGETWIVKLSPRYARGASYGDIRDHLREMYDLDVSPATISRVTDKSPPDPGMAELGRWSGFVPCMAGCDSL